MRVIRGKPRHPDRSSARPKPNTRHGFGGRKPRISSSVRADFSTIGEWPDPSIIAISAPGTAAKYFACAGGTIASSVPVSARSGGTGVSAASRSSVGFAVR
jgi:hypothetical protein